MTVQRDVLTGSWSDNDTALLHSLAAQGLRLAAIALRLRRSYDAVRRKARKEGIALAHFRRHSVATEPPAG
jgi:hypothetical protein